MKVVINTCYGGFSLSEKACNFLGISPKDFGYDYKNKRSDPKLIECIEKLGKEADGFVANLKVVEIPDGIDYTIEDYDGVESIHEKHRIWD